MQQGKLVDAYAEAVKSAGANENGAMNGFMGIGMMNMNTGNVVGNAAAGAWNNTENSRMDLSKEQQTFTEETQPEINLENKEEKTEEVAQEAKPEESNEWTCVCGNKNNGNFCTNCGKPKLAKKRCPKCNAELEANIKFCPNCGEKVE